MVKLKKILCMVAMFMILTALLTGCGCEADTQDSNSAAESTESTETATANNKDGDNFIDIEDLM